MRLKRLSVERPANMDLFARQLLLLFDETLAMQPPSA
jgi:hypothetical protein